MKAFIYNCINLLLIAGESFIQNGCFGISPWRQLIEILLAESFSEDDLAEIIKVSNWRDKLSFSEESFKCYDKMAV